LLAILGLVLFVYSAKGRWQAAWPLLLLWLWVGLVSYFSSAQGGSGPMLNWYERYGLTPEQAEAFTLGFRKTVHFTFYGTVGWTALQAARAVGAEDHEAVRTALLVAFAIASFDELRQSGYANRSGSPWDVLLDLTGAAVFVGLSEARRRRLP
jgi:VanZ family protein